MKKVISVCAVLLLTLGVACANADRPIKINEMPATAQSFLKTHFPNAKISFAKVDDELISKEYEVMLADGTKLEFASNGNWEDVDCRYGEVPAAIIPAAIKDYVKANYPDERVLKIERDRRGYDLKLSNRLELKFNNDFEIVDIDD